MRILNSATTPSHYFADKHIWTFNENIRPSLVEPPVVMIDLKGDRPVIRNNVAMTLAGLDGTPEALKPPSPTEAGEFTIDTEGENWLKLRAGNVIIGVELGPGLAEYPRTNLVRGEELIPKDLEEKHVLRFAKRLGLELPDQPVILIGTAGSAIRSNVPVTLADDKDMPHLLGVQTPLDTEMEDLLKLEAGGVLIGIELPSGSQPGAQ